MIQLLSEEFIPFSQLTARQKAQVEHAQACRRQSFENSLSVRQNSLLEREDALMQRMAVAAGFDAYDSGDYNYRDACRSSAAGMADERTRDNIASFDRSQWSGPFADEYRLLKADAKALKDFESSQLIWLHQQYLNDVLTLTHHKADKLRFSPSPREFDALSSEEQDALRVPVTTSVSASDGQTLQVDASIAHSLKSIWRAGVRTAGSCSGMVADHMNHRWLSDDRFGRWKAGENQFLKSENSHAYITLPLEGNHPQMVEKVRELAGSWGWVVIDCEVEEGDGIMLCPPHTLDGTSEPQIDREIYDAIEHICAQYGIDDWADAWDEARKVVEFNHGGRVMYTDRMLAHNWCRLAEGIGEVMYQIDRETLRQNMAAGRAVRVYDYDARMTLSPGALADVFRRSGITLDRDSIPSEGLHGVGDDIGRMPRFVVCGDKARLMDSDEPLPDRTLLESRQNLSRLLASQVRGTYYTSEPKPYDYRLSVMVHPEPRTIQQVEGFTLSCRLDSTEYFRLSGEDYDATYLLAAKFRDALYRAAADAYEHSVSRKADAGRDSQAVSDIRIRQGLDGYTYVSCHVHGERQLAKRISASDADFYRMRTAGTDRGAGGVAAELAHKYFRAEIDSAERDRLRGVAR